MSVRQVLSYMAVGVLPVANIHVHLHRPTGRVNRALVGFDFHFGGPPPASIAPLHPRFVRVDASLEQVSPARAAFNVTRLQHRVAQIRASGGEPLVILDYTPSWLGQPLAPLFDRTRTEPSDLNLWRALIKKTVLALARGKGHVRWFEAWNEPDLPTYWVGTPQGWLDTAAASAEGVSAAARQARLPLRFGGPASFIPDVVQIRGFVSRLRSEGLPPAFISWHYYANYPCVGPDGPENPGDPTSVALQRTLGCVNPAASPQIYETGIALVRGAVRSVSQRARLPALILDEWNLSAGGLDRRMNSNVGAAFDAGTLMTFQRSGLDASAFYQATDTDSRAGGWGTVTIDSRRRPSWSTFRFWQALQPVEVAVDGSRPDAGLWVVASRNSTGRRVSVLLASFSASRPTARTVALDFTGLAPPRRRWTVRVQRIDARHGGGESPQRASLSRPGRLIFSLPAQAVALIRLVAHR